MFRVKLFQLFLVYLKLVQLVNLVLKLVGRVKDSFLLHLKLVLDELQLLFEFCLVELKRVDLLLELLHALAGDYGAVVGDGVLVEYVVQQAVIAVEAALGHLARTRRLLDAFVLGGLDRIVRHGRIRYACKALTVVKCVEYVGAHHAV